MHLLGLQDGSGPQWLTRRITPHLLQSSIKSHEILNLGFKRATHTAARHTGPFVSSVHWLHLHHKEAEDTRSMSTQSHGCLDHFLKISVLTFFTLFTLHVIMQCKHIDSQKNTMSLHYVQSESLTSSLVRRRNEGKVSTLLPRSSFYWWWDRLH